MKFFFDVAGGVIQVLAVSVNVVLFNQGLIWHSMPLGSYILSKIQR
jgi:hypothetical protein